MVDCKILFATRFPLCRQLVSSVTAIRLFGIGKRIGEETTAAAEMSDAIDLANGDDGHPISADTLETSKVDEYEVGRTSFV